MIIIGTDSQKRTHTAVAVGPVGRMGGGKAALDHVGGDATSTRQAGRSLETNAPRCTRRGFHNKTTGQPISASIGVPCSARR